MRSMWTAVSDGDYYGFPSDEPGEDPLDQYSDNELSLFMADDGGDAAREVQL